MKYTIPGEPRTKKNSSRIIKCGKGYRLIPSKAYTAYADVAGWHLRPKPREPISNPVCVCCVYYMATRRRVDLVNLLEATCDILVQYGILADDNSQIVVSHDGSRVRLDRKNPRVEITITEVRT